MKGEFTLLDTRVYACIEGAVSEMPRMLLGETGFPYDAASSGLNDA